MMLKTAVLLITTGASALWQIFAAVPLTGYVSAPSTISVKETGNRITNAVALDSFFRQLAVAESRKRTQPIRIVQYGDSHTKADLFTGAVRAKLLHDFGVDMPQLVRRTAYRPASADGQPIVYRPLGINGARAKRLRDMSESESFLQGVSQTRPDLIVIAYGTNEVTDGDWTVASYSRMLVGIITRLRAAAPDASFLIIGPPDRSVPGTGGWTSAAQMPLLIEAQRRAAILAGAAFWSEYDAMGGAGSMNAWVTRGLGRPDHVHFTATGYSRLAGLFYAELMNDYRGKRPGAPDLRGNFDLRVMRGVPVTVIKPN